MSTSLVADYSDSNSEQEDEYNDIKSEVNPDVRIKVEPGISDSSTSNFFTTIDKNCGGDDDDGDSTADKTVDSKPIIKQESVDKLPNPITNGQEKLPSIFEAATSRIGTSVFVNPFEEAEQAKNQILEKHVKLTQVAPKKPAHQPMCFKFRKGTCHLGKSCRFFHDRENVTVEENVQTSNPSSRQSFRRQVYHPSAYLDARRRPLEQEPADEDGYMANMGRKRRFGVTDHLLPPQKALESLQRQREIERPWTLPQS